MSDQGPLNLSDLPRGRVVVAGDVMLDRYLSGQASRLSQEAPVPVVDVQSRYSALGGAANVAANVAAAGSDVTLIGAVGEDASGSELSQLLAHHGIRNQLVEARRPTTVKTRILARGQQVVRVDEEVRDALPEAHRRAFETALLRALVNADVLLLADYDKGALSEDTLSTVILTARRWKIPVVVDPKEREYRIYQGATLIKPNLTEFNHAYTTQVVPGLGGKPAPFLEERAAQARKYWNVGGVLVTCGADGMLLHYTRGQDSEEVFATLPGRPVEVADISGAGDTVLAWLGAMIASGRSIVEACRFANLAASLQVAKAGTAVVYPQEVQALLESESGATAAHADHQA